MVTTPLKRLVSGATGDSDVKLEVEENNDADGGVHVVLPL
jgi:hypothetical protein